MVTAEIQGQAARLQFDEEKVVAQLADYDIERLEGLRQEIQHIENRLLELMEQSAKLYEDKVSGSIDKSAFILLMRRNEQERVSQTEQQKKLQVDLAAMEQAAVGVRNWTAGIKKYLDLQELDRAVIDELIDHIEVGERRRIDGKLVQDIKVVYRFVGLVE